MLSQYVEESYARDLLADGLGGVGYLLKDRVQDLDALEGALARVASGGSAIDAEVVAQLLVRHRSADPLGALTPREREVLALMAEGRSNAGIAQQLVVSDGAVEKHIRNVFIKLDLPPCEEDHRRVLAVLAWLGGQVLPERPTLAWYNAAARRWTVEVVAKRRHRTTERIGSLA